jgi:hypothetical protein
VEWVKRAQASDGQEVMWCMVSAFEVVEMLEILVGCEQGVVSDGPSRPLEVVYC